MAGYSDFGEDFYGFIPLFPVLVRNRKSKAGIGINEEKCISRLRRNVLSSLNRKFKWELDWLYQASRVKRACTPSPVSAPGVITGSGNTQYNLERYRRYTVIF
jgi:hypothetical protein